MKKCYKCNEKKLLEDFYNNKYKADGKQTICKTCSNKRRVEYYKENKERETIVKNKNKRKIKQWFKDLKDTLECNECGENHPATLQFHHKNGKKEFNISNAVCGSFSKEKILEEMKKCVILCANCHMKIHYVDYYKWVDENRLSHFKP